MLSKHAMVHTMPICGVNVYACVYYLTLALHCTRLFSACAIIIYSPLCHTHTRMVFTHAQYIHTGTEGSALHCF